MARPDHEEAIRRLDVLAVLAPFDPHVAGTPPLGINLPGSDIDIICHAPDAAAFAATAWDAFGMLPDFRIHQWIAGDRAVIACFSAHGWEFELFGHPSPVEQQAGWRHFCIERRLLALAGEPFRERIMAERRAGLKTEPAFAKVLDLPDNPYEALLELEALLERELARLLKAAGYCPSNTQSR